MAEHEVIVVGAGPAGLATAAGLRRAGVPALVIDRADTVGAAWRTRYDSFRLHTIRWLSGLPGLTMPRRLGRWVRRDDFVAYLEAYAETFAIRPRLGTTLTGLHRGADGWTLQTSTGELTARRVVLATGACNQPYLPEWPGRTSFDGSLIHSSAYRRPEPYAGQRVLVVGAGNSATEIATDLARAGVAVELAVRSAPSILRRDFHGFPTQLLGIALRPAPAIIADPLGAATRRLTIPDLSAQGLAAPKKPYSVFERTGTVPILDHGFVAAVRSGAITIRPAVTGFEGDAVLHEDGARTQPDAVIAATGYSPGLGSVLGPLDRLDARGLPTVGSGGADGLHTVGITIVLSGLLREIGRDARRAVTAISE